jgi:hypothetical protein
VVSGTYTGGCLCGDVRYAVRGPLRPVIACHCSQCRRTSGHYVAATAAREADLSVAGADSVTWFRSSEQARRGFCRTCGASLFWQRDGSGQVGIMAGSLDPPSGLQTAAHIFVQDKGDYYDVTGDFARLDHGDHDIEVPAPDEAS